MKGATPVNVIVSVVESPLHISEVPLIVPVGFGKYETVVVPVPVFVQLASVTFTIVYVPGKCYIKSVWIRCLWQQVPEALRSVHR